MQHKPGSVHKNIQKNQ